MSEKPICPQCGNSLPSYAPQGVCPSCIARANLETGPTALHSDSGGRPPPMAVEVVARLFPEMEIVELIGAGGMGAVYKARQPALDRLVALKVLDRQGRDPAFVERFTREAKTLARLNHPNIVAVHEFGEREGFFFLLMELVDGVTLRGLLREGKMEPEQALAIVPPICEALQYAHEKGVVHRDIKPENILIDKEGRVKVADFGIARLAGTERVENLTGEGQVIGTAHYMAPEQVERPAEVDHRADIYALGVVFYEMLTGELPLGRFPNPSKRVQIDVRLDEIVLKALEKEPDLRYQQASEVKTGVETAMKPPSPSDTATVPAGARPWQLWVVAALFILAGATAVWEYAREWEWIFEPDPRSRIYGINFGILGLPIGIGLLRLRPWWRMTALVTLGMSFAGVLLLGGLWLSGHSLQQSTIRARVFERELSDGGAVALGMLIIAVAMLVMIWIWRVLVCPEIKALFQRRGFARPWIEWAALAAALLLSLSAVWFLPAAEGRIVAVDLPSGADPAIQRAAKDVRPAPAFLGDGDRRTPREAAPPITGAWESAGFGGSYTGVEHMEYEFRPGDSFHGRVRIQGEEEVVFRGTYAIEGDTLRLTIPQLEETEEFQWALRDGMLTLRDAEVDSWIQFRKLLPLEDAVEYAMGDFPQSVALADLNGDGRLDVMTANRRNNSVTVRLGAGEGTFAEPASYTTDPEPLFVRAADLNGDGILELITANYSNTITVFPGQGDGTFRDATSYSVGEDEEMPINVVVAEFNGDGIPDLATANFMSNSVSLFPGEGGGVFISPVQIRVGDGPVSIVTADFNADGHADIAVANRRDSTATVLLGNGKGEFAATSFEIGARAGFIAAGDLTNDGVIDLAVACFSDNSITLLLGDGRGKFSRRDVGLGSLSPSSLALADMNGDGWLDIVAVCQGARSVAVLRNGKEAHFSAQPKLFRVGAAPDSVALGDLNGNGFADIVAANLNGSSISVLLSGHEPAAAEEMGERAAQLRAITERWQAAAREAVVPGGRPNLTGIVRSADTGQPLAEATVFIHTAAPREGPGILCPSCYLDCSKKGDTNAAGRFTIEDLDPKLTFEVLVVAKGYQPQFVAHVDPLMEPMDVALKPVSPGDSPGHRVRGRVLDPDGRPVAGAVATLRGVTQNGRTWWGHYDGIDPVAVTGDDGEFVLHRREPFEEAGFIVEARGLAKRVFPRMPTGDTVHELEMIEGLTVTGRVLKDGEPLAGIEVGMMGMARGVDVSVGDYSVATDEEGRFLFVNVPPQREYVVYGMMRSLGEHGAIPVQRVLLDETASGTGMSLYPVLTPRKVQRLDDGSLDLGDLKVEPGHQVEGQIRLADERSVPPRTRVFLGRPDAWDWQETEADGEGRFRFSGVPGETIEISAGITGYILSLRNANLDPWKPHHLLGQIEGDKKDLILELEPGTRRGRLPGDPSVVRQEPLRGAEERDSSREDRGGPTGVVVGPDGEPAAGATVYLLDLGNHQIQVRGNSENGWHAHRVSGTRTDEAGRFSFAPAEDIFGIIAVDERGYVQMRVEEFEGEQEVRLQPWARVEGRLTIGAEPAVNERVRLGLAHIPYEHHPRKIPPLLLHLETETDGEGNFAFERVPPGHLGVYHSPNVRDGRPGTNPQAQAVKFTAMPGETHQLALGGEGHRVVGQFAVKGHEGEVDWLAKLHTLELVVPRPPELPDTLALYRDFNAASEAATTDEEKEKLRVEYEAEREEAMRQWREFYATEAGRRYHFAKRKHALHVSSDGSFRIEDVPGGRYKLNADLSNLAGGPDDGITRIFLAGTEVEIPEAPGGRAEEPYDLGLIELQAPRFEAGQ